MLIFSHHLFAYLILYILYGLLLLLSESFQEAAMLLPLLYKPQLQCNPYTDVG